MSDNQNWNSLTEPRLGIMLHYDDSASDEGAVMWLKHDPRCHVSYNDLVLDNGSLVVIAPLDKRAWHAGVCRPSNGRLAYRDANSAFYGIAAATNDRQPVMPMQFQSIVQRCRDLFLLNGWHPKDDGWRITGHDAEAWPRGRKIDPLGSHPEKPILSVVAVRAALAGDTL